LNVSTVEKGSSTGRLAMPNIPLTPPVIVEQASVSFLLAASLCVSRELTATSTLQHCFLNSLIKLSFHGARHNLKQLDDRLAANISAMPRIPNFQKLYGLPELE
jgi:hypothetical protein